MRFEDGQPGDAFLTSKDGRWTIWKYLDGELLEQAIELGYDRRVVSAVLSGDEETPVFAMAEPEDQPKYMARPDESFLRDAEWTYLGKL